MTEYDVKSKSSYRFKYKHQIDGEKEIINFKNHLSNINMYYCNKSGIDTFREIVKMVELNKLSVINLNIGFIICVCKFCVWL